MCQIEIKKGNIFNRPVKIETDLDLIKKRKCTCKLRIIALVAYQNCVYLEKFKHFNLSFRNVRPRSNYK